MLYCVQVEEFEFNPQKYESIEQAYYSLEQNDSQIIRVFETIEEAEVFLEKECGDIYYEELNHIKNQVVQKFILFLNVNGIGMNSIILIMKLRKHLTT